MEAQDDYFVKNLHHYMRLYPLNKKWFVIKGEIETIN